MRWSVLGLVVMGIVAAVSVTILVNALRLGQNRATASGGPAQRQIIVAAQDLEPATRVLAEWVEELSVEEKEAPLNSLTSPTQMIGKILARPMLKGEVFTQESVATELQGQFLAGTLESGMRLVSVTLNKAASLGSLLYVGCKVDVLASYSLTKKETRTQTILEDVEIVAIEDRSIVSPKSADPKARRSTNAKLTVTLMLDSEQAEEFQSARSEAAISLALRNPKETPSYGMGEEVAASQLAPTGRSDTGPQTRIWVMEVIRAGKNESVEFEELEEQTEE